MARHDDGTPYYDIPAPGTVEARTWLSRVDAAERAAADGPDRVVTNAAEAARGRLDPWDGVSVQAVRIVQGPGLPDRLLLCVHHLVVDGVSWRVLLPDLIAAANARAEGRAANLAPVPVSYRTWAEDTARRAAAGARRDELDHWTRVLGGPPEPWLGARPLDPARDTAATARHTRVTVPPDVAGALLKEVPSAFHGRVDDLLLTALARAVASWRARQGTAAPTDPVLVDVEGHGRESGHDLSRTVGWFTSVHPVRLTAHGEDLPRVVKRVKEQLRTAPGGGTGYGALRHLDPEAGETLAALPAPQILFNYLGRVPGGDRDEAGWTVLPTDALPYGADPAMSLRHALEVNVQARSTPAAPELHAVWTTPSALFTQDELAALTGLWLEELRALAALGRQPGSGGRTPSDLPLVALDQHEIERLECAAPGLTDILPVTALQEGFLFHAAEARDGGVDVYTTQVRLDLEGPVNSAALLAAGERLVARHTGLRAGFHQPENGPAVQAVVREVPLPWAEIDLSGQPAELHEAEADRIAEQERLRGFDLIRPPLLRLTLIRFGLRRYRLLLTGHHIAWDGWSTPILVTELLALWADGGGGSLPRPVPHKHHLEWLAAQDPTAAERAWAAHLDGLEGPLLMAPEAADRPAVLQRQVSQELPHRRCAVWSRGSGGTA